MSARWQNSTHADWGHGEGRRRGLVLLEVALAVLVAGLAAGLVLTWAGRLQQRRNCATYVRDLRVFSAVFADYFQRHKAWPPTGEAGAALPAEIAAALKDTRWSNGSPFGGSYGWVAPNPAGAAGSPRREWGGRGAVTLTAFSPSFPLSLEPADLLYIDRLIDDGNLATGRFRTGFNGWPVYLVEAGKP